MSAAVSGNGLAIDACEIVKRYSDGPEPVLRGATMQVREGELTCLIGPSGCGKTTLLRCFNGLERYDTGKLTVAGVEVEGAATAPDHSASAAREVRELRRRVGFVFQQFNLFPHLDVMENITLAPVKVCGATRARAEALALELLDKVGLRDKARSYPEKLSGGQQQRVAIARALAVRPRIMLYDEPTSALDPAMRDEVLKVMTELRHERITQVVVTHEMGFVRDAADVVCFAYAGRIHEHGSPRELFDSPRTEELRLFLKM